MLKTLFFEIHQRQKRHKWVNEKTLNEFHVMS